LSRTKSISPAKPKIERLYLTFDELRTIYKILEFHYISYEDTDAIALVRKIRDIINGIHERRQTTRRMAREKGSKLLRSKE
jgi:hypothetical protein